MAPSCACLTQLVADADRCLPSAEVRIETRCDASEDSGLLAIAACGVAVWLAASASGSGSANGGTLRVNISKSDVTTLDPQIDYEFLGGSILWIMREARLLPRPACAARLADPPQRPPPACLASPRTAARTRSRCVAVTASTRGSRSPLRAFGRAFERIFAPKMGSPGVNFVSDIVGAGAALKGKRALPTGIKVSGNKLSISLVKPAPDLVARLAMNFFCAVPVNTPIDSNGVTPAMAGPCYIAQRVPDRLIVLKANPTDHGPRPHHLAEIDFTRTRTSNELPADRQEPGGLRPVRNALDRDGEPRKALRRQPQPLLGAPRDDRQLSRDEHEARPISPTRSCGRR